MKICNIITDDKNKFYQKYYSDGSVDIIYDGENTIVKTGSFKTIKLNLNLQISDQFFARLQARSSINGKGIIIGESIIDANYTGKISVFVYNLSDEDFELKKGYRYFSVSVYERIPVKLHEVDRKDNNNGSTNT